MSSVQCPVSSVQDEEQNQEYEEKGRRRKLDEVSPLIIDPPPVQGGFFYSPWGMKRWQRCVVKVPAGGDSDVSKRYLQEVTVMCCKSTWRR